MRVSIQPLAQVILILIKFWKLEHSSDLIEKEPPLKSVPKKESGRLPDRE